MARLHEHQGKRILARHGVEVPQGAVATTAEQARRIAADLGGKVVVKMQAFTTSRKAQGGIALVDTPDGAADAAARMLQMRIGAFPVEKVLVEAQLDIARELFISLSVDDAARAPVLLLSLAGGSGVEQRAGAVHKIAVDVRQGVDADQLDRALAQSDLDERAMAQVRDVVMKIFDIAHTIDARSLEINPLAVTKAGDVVAADCRIAIDDYAAFRQPELDIEIAREFDHPPTELEKIAYAIEQADHRGTFYFAQLPRTSAADERLVGFHGAGGGGSMMSMDALNGAGFAPANFTDTSGNPSSAKVYAAARIILSQPGLVGYFGSGSGVASQEQHHSAYGLAKAFLELGLDVPAVIRLGGNNESRAVQILQDACAALPATVEGYIKDDTPRFIAKRFRKLVNDADDAAWTPRARIIPDFVGSAGAYSFAVRAGDGWTGRVWIDHTNCSKTATALLLDRAAGALTLDDAGKPVLAVDAEQALSLDSAMIEAEIDLRIMGEPVVFVDLPIAGLDDTLDDTMDGGSGAL